MDDKDLAPPLIPLDFFTKVVKSRGPEMEERHQDLKKKDVIVEFNGAEYVVLFRYATHVLDDLEYYSQRGKTSRSDKVVDDYVLISGKYLEIWALIMLGISRNATFSGENVSVSNVRDIWDKALEYFQAIYKHTRDVIEISLENGLLASVKE